MIISVSAKYYVVHVHEKTENAGKVSILAVWVESGSESMAQDCMCKTDR